MAVAVGGRDPQQQALVARHGCVGARRGAGDLRPAGEGVEALPQPCDARLAVGIVEFGREAAAGLGLARPQRHCAVLVGVRDGHRHVERGRRLPVEGVDGNPVEVVAVGVGGTVEVRRIDEVQPGLAQRKAAVYGQIAPVGARQRPDHSRVLRIVGAAQCQRAAVALVDGAGVVAVEFQRLVDVGDRDRHVQRRPVDAVVDRHRHSVFVVGVRVGA